MRKLSLCASPILSTVSLLFPSRAINYHSLVTSIPATMFRLNISHFLFFILLMETLPWLLRSKQGWVLHYHWMRKRSTQCKLPDIQTRGSYSILSRILEQLVFISTFSRSFTFSICVVSLLHAGVMSSVETQQIIRILGKEQKLRVCGPTMSPANI